MAAVDIREPVAKPLVLTGLPPVGKKWHPLGAGIPAKKSYPSAKFGRLALPGGEPALSRLKAVLATSIPDLPDSLALECWGMLLSSSPFVADAPVKQDDLFLNRLEGLPDTDDSVNRLRRVVLGAVFQRSNETITDGALTSPRLGAIATLTVLTSSAGCGPAEDAWLHARWVSSTRSMLLALEDVSSLDVAEAKEVRRVELLLSERLSSAKTDLIPKIERIGQLAGTPITVHVVDGRVYGRVGDLTLKSPGYRLLIAGSELPVSLGDTYAARFGRETVLPLASDSPDELLHELREALPAVAGVGPGLMAQPAEPPQTSAGHMPIAAASECVHVGSVVYVLDGGTGLWWTRDHTGHAGVVFKTYKRENAVLRWVGDHDADGVKYLGKSKGSAGKTVPLAGHRSCPRPGLHV